MNIYDKTICKYKKALHLASNVNLIESLIQKSAKTILKLLVISIYLIFDLLSMVF